MFWNFLDHVTRFDIGDTSKSSDSEVIADVQKFQRIKRQLIRWYYVQANWAAYNFVCLRVMPCIRKCVRMRLQIFILIREQNEWLLIFAMRPNNQMIVFR